MNLRASARADDEVPPSAARGHELFISPGIVMICLLCGGISTGKNTSLRDRCPPPPYSKRAQSHVHRFLTRRHPADSHRQEDLECQRRLRFSDP